MLTCSMFRVSLSLHVCRCDPGWDGEQCERCVPMPGCLHGSCQQPWQCSCEPGWGGRFCDKGQKHDSKRFFFLVLQKVSTSLWMLKHLFSHFCVFSFFLDQPFSKHPIFSVSDLFVCAEQQPCQNGATCLMEDSGKYTCVCPEGFHGTNCQLKAGPCHQRRSGPVPVLTPISTSTLDLCSQTQKFRRFHDLTPDRYKILPVFCQVSL